MSLSVGARRDLGDLFLLTCPVLPVVTRCESVIFLVAHIFNPSPIDSALEEFLPDGASFGLVVSLVEVGGALSDIRRGWICGILSLSGHFSDKTNKRIDIKRGELDCVTAAKKILCPLTCNFMMMSFPVLDFFPQNVP